MQIIDLLKQHNKLNSAILLLVMSLISFFFSLFRYLFTDTHMFLFLNWNLFLAAIPWAFSTIILIRPQLHRKKLKLGIILGSWLLFFPNAPYILTDLFHLKEDGSMPIWFDLVLILCFAWTGLMFGFLSLFDIEKYLENFFKKWTIQTISVLILFVGSFGVYVGRYLRWNSWDIITEPFSLLYDIGKQMVNPFSHLRTWGMTLFLGILLNMIYWSFRAIRSK